jgi:hypothetical protein
MSPPVYVFLFGSLVKKMKSGQKAPVRLNLLKPLALLEVLEILDIGTKEISLALVNHKSLPGNWLIRPGDRLSLFPREYPIFADWLDHRLNVYKT